MVIETKEPVVVDLLERLGFTKASAKVKELVVRKRKMALAYEFYKFVRPEKIKEFNQKLAKKTRDSYGGYKMLDFVGIESYEGAPPLDVLNALQTAQDHKCFDKFEVGYIREVPDPLLMGVINGCADKFFIAQWDNDISITDLLKPNEG